MSGTQLRVPDNLTMGTKAWVKKFKCLRNFLISLISKVVCYYINKTYMWVSKSYGVAERIDTFCPPQHTSQTRQKRSVLTNTFVTLSALFVEDPFPKTKQCKGRTQYQNVFEPWGMSTEGRQNYSLFVWIRLMTFCFEKHFSVTARVTI